MSDPVAVKNTSPRPTLPLWFTNDLLVPFKAGIVHTFLFHGDVTGLVPNPDFVSGNKPDNAYITVREFIEMVFRSREMVIFYNLASGISFLRPDMEKEFRKLVGLDKDDDSASRDPVAAAKAGLAAKRGIPREPEACFPLIDKVLKTRKGAALVISSAHFIAPEVNSAAILPQNERVNIERLRNWSQDDRLRRNGAILVLMSDRASKVSSELRQSGSEVRTVFIPKPSTDERKKFINSLVALKDGPGINTLKFSVPEDFDIDIFAHATQGMSLRQILETFLYAKRMDLPISLDEVKARKRKILNDEYGEVMEVVEPLRGLEDIGGHAHVKEYFCSLLEAMRRSDERLVAMGVTLIGPPGTGKTAIVEALAKEAGFNFAKVKNIRGSLVGESEAKQERLEEGLWALAPIVVMNDEADLKDANRDAPKGDSGVSERLMKQWMEFLSNPRIRGKVLVINCTNRPDRMDAALKRSGRSDERILIPMPSRNEIPEILQVMLKRHGIMTDMTDFSTYVEMLDGLSGADYESIVLRSLRFAQKFGTQVVNDRFLREAIQDFIPSASQAEIDRMTICGLLECSSRRLLPPHIKEIVAGIKNRNLVENLDKLLEQLKARNIVDLDT